MKHKTAYLGLLLALALVCSYVEALIPIDFGIPGVKLGLTNIVVVLIMYLIGPVEAISVSLLRVVIAGFMFGNLFSIIYSAAGALLSFLVMLLLKNLKILKPIAVSTAGGIAHNIGQLIIAAVIVENYNIFYYIPVLLVAGTITGFLIGILATELIIRLKDVIRL